MAELLELKLAAQAREIQTLASELAAEKQAHDDAVKAERAAEAKFLGHVAELAKPALPAIASRVEFFPQHRGVLLFDGWKPGDGEVRGRRVYLLADGTFAETWRTFAPDDECVTGKCGTCSKLRHSATVPHPKRQGVFVQFRSYASATCIVSAHDPKPLVAGLHEEMKRQRGKRVPCTIEAHKTTEKLHAILTLIG